MTCILFKLKIYFSVQINIFIQIQIPCCSVINLIECNRSCLFNLHPSSHSLTCSYIVRLLQVQIVIYRPMFAYVYMHKGQKSIS